MSWSALGTENLLIIDLSGEKHHTEGHIPGARPLGYSKIVRAEKPVMGLLPKLETFGQALL